jgi:predicted SprT family Zn-dependent metalloprotease
MDQVKKKKYERRIKAVIRLTQIIMKKHGIERKVEVSKKMTRHLGLCYRTRIVYSLEYILTAHSSAIIDTVKHEIAHALPFGHGHGPLWQKNAIKLGARPTRYAKSPYPKPFMAKCKCKTYYISKNKHPEWHLNRYCRKCKATLGPVQPNPNYPTDVKEFIQQYKTKNQPKVASSRKKKITGFNITDLIRKVAVGNLSITDFTATVKLYYSNQGKETKWIVKRVDHLVKEAERKAAACTSK